MQNRGLQDLIRPISVLLIDDHPTLVAGLTLLIERSETKMEVVGTSATCEKALELARKTTPDVIVLDLYPSYHSGADILPALIAHSKSRVLLFTGERDEKKLDLAVARGARGVLCKDAPGSTVLTAIQQLHEGGLWLDPQRIARVLSKLANPPEFDS